MTTKNIDWNGGYIYGNMSVSQAATISDPSDAHDAAVRRVQHQP